MLYDNSITSIQPCNHCANRPCSPSLIIFDKGYAFAMQNYRSESYPQVDATQIQKAMASTNRNLTAWMHCYTQ